MILMTKHDTIKLVAEATPRGVNDQPVESERTVYCTVKSVGMRESYEAMAHGLHPEVVFCLTQDFEYQGEKLCLWNGVYYDIVRTYVTEEDGIELTAQRASRQVVATA